MIKRFLVPLFALAVLTEPALPQTRALPPGEIRANGDITFGNALKLGKREGNKTVITPDMLQILGSGSTGDASAMTVLPNAGAPQATLSALLANRLTLLGNDITANPDNSIADKVPFANTGAKHFLFSRRNGPANALLGTTSIIRNTVGSGTFGPGAADYSLLLSSVKDGAFSAVGNDAKEGELDTLIVVGHQGKKGDLGGVIVDVEKRRDNLTSVASDESGGVVAFEANVGLRNAAGQQYHRMHPILGMAESPAGVSGGRGYGAYMETRSGEWFSAYHASSFVNGVDESGVYFPNSWRYYFTGATDRDVNKLNYLVDNTGRTHNGFPAARMGYGFDATANAFTIVDDTAGIVRARLARDGGGMSLDGQYVSLTFNDPVTGAASGGSHRYTSSGNGTFIYQVSSAANFGSAVNAYSVGGNGAMAISNLTAGLLTMTGLAKLAPYTVATLPVCNASNRDAIAVASDLTTASAGAFRGAPAGGGTARGPVYCDGAAWTVH